MEARVGAGTVFIDEGEIRERFIRSSGPGGQNVNKVATAVRLRFDVRNSRTVEQKKDPAGLAKSLICNGGPSQN